jgi:hypothetical protein
MAEERLCGSQVAQAHLDMAGERMPKVVEAEPGDLGLLECRPPSSLDAHVSSLGLVVPEHVVRTQVAG